MHGGLVAGSLERGVGKLLVAELQLLQAHQVGLALAQPVQHEVEAGPQAVHVPGRRAHRAMVPEAVAGSQRSESAP